MEREKASVLNSVIASMERDELINRILSRAIHDNLSIAVWRMPNQDTSFLFVDFNNVRSFEIDELEELPPSFVFSPFQEEGKKLLIQGHLQIKFNETFVQLNPLTAKEEFLIWLENALESNVPISLNSKNNIQSTTRDDYVNWVSQGIQNIEAGEFKKVVPARVLTRKWAGNFAIIYRSLCSKYPNAFISLTYTSASGCWIGATPELLLSVNKNKIFVTSSLAGTKAYNTSEELHNVTWTQKEIEEQAMVSRYIINCFKTIRLREFEEEGPMTVKAANLVHLKTNFIVDMKATHFPNLGSTMLRLLHPTSAVCGMPKVPALKFLKDHENFDREYFSGYLGPVNVEEETNIFVNIRCARLFEDKAVIFAGAGVTSYSKAESEWKETELKCKTLLDVMS